MQNRHDKIKVDVLICTYKRPKLLRSTLNGIENGNNDGLLIRVIVVDNDNNESARELVKRYIANSTHEYIYLTQPIQNISITRNCALAASDGDYAVFIDDDEVPEPDWIQNLVKTARGFRKQIVFGPVISRYVDNIPKWIIDGGFFEFRSRYVTGTKIPLLEMRTGNVLICGNLLRQTNSRFDHQLGLSGGEDYEFFRNLVSTGVIGIWCDEAQVHEWVPRNRATVKWLIRRSFRIGSVDGFSRRRSRQIKKIFIALAKGIALFLIGSINGSLLCFCSKHEIVRALQKTFLGLGIIYGVFHGPYSEYRDA
jgi:glycosyltransferase involved in cell wall biosynthesis